MRSPFQKGPGPRIRALTGAPSRLKAPATAAPQAAGTVFREFVATLERLEKSRRRKKAPAAPTERS
ncbi:hypothetical protein Xaut_3153 [Xanthobacter versatilis]|uniref:Uncharacterized protein n=1 Tax=Xanthobacter autotrophicus (strain ATCC BAA-1158 / Py2) TaxID=78245 RepID=A7IK40_XANP2|nr:hypothetical protein Xaut_3153 [Xanthobacter autotrophicus Py2]